MHSVRIRRSFACVCVHTTQGVRIRRSFVSVCVALTQLRKRHLLGCQTEPEQHGSAAGTLGESLLPVSFMQTKTQHNQTYTTSGRPVLRLDESLGRVRASGQAHWLYVTYDDASPQHEVMHPLVSHRLFPGRREIHDNMVCSGITGRHANSHRARPAIRAQSDTTVMCVQPDVECSCCYSFTVLNH